jgi:hypothetical protein
MTEKIVEDSRHEETPMEWSLWREDIYGNQVRMPLELTDERAAFEAEAEYTARGHHQTYFAREVPVGDMTTFIPAKGN